MADHKNQNEAVGNYCVYQITILGRIFKFGKADTDRITKSSGEPTRIHQQKRELRKEREKDAVSHELLLQLVQTSTEMAKEAEKQIIQSYYEQTGEIPEGNQKSFKSE